MQEPHNWNTKLHNCLSFFLR